ncbi:MAG: beta-ketoacyl-ACP synthase II [Anaerolineales bacterium]|nr:beta-ketoacyl-ACP synthase II [Anaerolineales bacterium]
MSDRVVITGMGTINPLGHSVTETWQNAVNGVSGVGPITLFDPKDHQVHIACEVKDFQPNDYMPAKDARKRDRFEQLALVAAREAINQAELTVDEDESDRVGVIVSSAIGGINSLEDAILTIENKGPRRVNPFVIPMLMANGASGLIGIDHQYKGPNFCIVSACASGSDSIGLSWLMIKAGMIDVAITGASEATITSTGVAAFDRIGAMSRRYEDYSMTPQPFDLNRDGLVMGEGGAILVLEKESRALKRGAEIKAEIAGYGATADAFHVTAPAEDGEGSSKAMIMALTSAGVNVEDVDYINAHGTATQLNDLAETRAIKSVFGDTAYKIPVSSTKSMTGHMMGATGALEAIFCVQAIQHNLIPPTLHYKTPDPECNLDYVPNEAREKSVKVAINNAFGFGGHNSVLVLREYSLSE